MKKYTFLLLLFLTTISYAQLDLPITFEDSSIDYDLTDFEGGGPSQIVVDPTNPSNMVAQVLKSSTAGSSAGTTMGEMGIANPIPFSNGNTSMTVRVWSPDAGIEVRLKVEKAGDPTISVETTATSTVAMGWETLVFDFSNQAPGTAAINLANTYDKISIFFNFGVEGAVAGNKTYFWDDVTFGDFVGQTMPNLPITFEDTATVDYNLFDFGGNSSMIVQDPTDATNLVGQATKAGDAMTWAGTTIGNDGLAGPVPFTTNSTKMTVRVWSPDAGTPIRVKVEDAGNPAISVETQTNTTTAMAWETLEFDFANQATGTAALNLANTYNKLSIFFNFDVDGATAGEKTYYWDDMIFLDNGPGLSQVDLPITFEDTSTVDYNLGDFGGNSSMIVQDPTDASNLVGQAIKAGDAMTWAGTTIGNDGLASPVPFTTSDTKMTVRVWSPDAGTPIRVKVEDAGNPAISVETQTSTTTAMAWETLEFDFANQATGTAALNLTNTYNKLSIFFNFDVDGATAGEKTYYWDDMIFLSTEPVALDLPITFEDTAIIDYALSDFAGAASQIITDPTDATNLVVEVVRSDSALIFAGTTAGENGLANPIPFTAADTRMSVRVWSPDAGVPIRLKVEDAGDPTVSVETETSTTVAGQWETLAFNFSNPVSGTAALNLDNMYNKVTIFFNFGTDGATAGEKIYYFDDVEFLEGGGNLLNQVDLPITFEDTATVDYALVDFGGNVSSIVTDPTDPMNLVVEATKLGDAVTFAGTTAGNNGLANPIPFTGTSTKMTVRVWSPDAGIPVRLKVEDASNPAVSVETEATTTVASAWETLEFDFNNEAPGTAAINLDNTYDKVTIFFNFGTDGATAGEKTYYFDDIEFVVNNLEQVDLPITFEDTATVDYALVDFGGNVSSIVTDPTDPMNLVVEATKLGDAVTFAGTTAGNNGLANPIPFTAEDTRITVRVWSPDANIPVRLKVEDASNGAISVETEVSTTVAGEWETLDFNFSNPVAGTPSLNLNNTYDKITIFFNFGTDGATAGEKTYYFDDIEFVEGGGKLLDQVDLPITFEETATIDYALGDFGGNLSTIIIDPTDDTNMVVQSVKTGGAQTFAGTTAGTNGLVNPIPFTADETKMKVRVWSPDANIPVRLKVEDATDPTISVETEATTTVAEQWETLEFDFSNEAAGTAALNIANTYDKVSIFFNFGTDGATAGEKTYYWDDIEFGARLTVVDIIVNSADHNTLEQAVIAAQLDDDLSGAGPFTVFAPTDDAFDNLPAGTLDALLADPTGELAELLLHHVLPGEIYSTDLMDGQTAITSAGFEVSISIVGDDISVDDALVITADIPADNGVVHVINGVILIDSGLSVVNAADYGIEVLPNPASDYLTINFTDGLTEVLYMNLFDLNGKSVSAGLVTDQVHHLNVSALPSGMYLLRLDDSSRSYIQKVVIKK